MTFSHPLARSARVFTARNTVGGEYRVLSIVTTLELDPTSHDYKKPFVEKLSRAAADYLAGSSDVAVFILMNRSGDWSGRLSSQREKQRRPK
jgi:hypothetical protein